MDINHTKEYEKLEIDRTEEHTRAYLKVQDGCNQFCTYCMIPYARGRIRSKKTEDVVGEVKRLAASGCQEVVLTGIHLSSYGIDTGESLLELIQKVHEIDGIRKSDQQSAESVSAFSSVTAKWMYCYTEANESTVHSAGVPGKM